MAAPTYTDEELLAALRSAAEGMDGPLTVAAYDAWRGVHGGASGIGIIRRFGKWHAACERAGVEAVSTTKKAAFDDAAIVAAVAAYLDDPESRGSYGGYREWAKGRGVPSGPTVRNHFPRWAELVELARRREASASGDGTTAPAQTSEQSCDKR